MKKIYIIHGKSGSGKTILANSVSEFEVPEADLFISETASDLELFDSVSFTGLSLNQIENNVNKLGLGSDVERVYIQC